MLKKVIFPLLFIFLLVGCSKTSELHGVESIEILQDFIDAKESYVGTSERHYLDNNLAVLIETGAYAKPNNSAMIYAENLDDGFLNESVYVALGNRKYKSGTYDFEEVYGVDCANSFISQIKNSLIFALDNNYFNLEETENGFIAKCNNESFIMENNMELMSVLIEEQSLKEFLGENMKPSLEIEFKTNEMNGLDVVSTTTFTGDSHEFIIEKIIQIILDEETLKSIKEDFQSTYLDSGESS